jgi:hypothetical protein
MKRRNSTHLKNITTSSKRHHKTPVHFTEAGVFSFMPSQFLNLFFNSTEGKPNETRKRTQGRKARSDTLRFETGQNQ